MIAAARAPDPPTTAAHARRPSRSQIEAALRVALVACGALTVFAALGVQLIRLGASGGADGRGPRLSVAAPLAESYARPSMIDRNGQLIAVDIAVPSIFADPAKVVGVDHTAEELAETIPGLDVDRVRALLSNKKRRFEWIERKAPPALAQVVHDLGLPGIDFRSEPKRFYPAGALAGHVIGSVDINNRGIAGLERMIDETIGVELEHGSSLSEKPPVRLTLSLAAQQALEVELGAAITRYRAEAATGIILDVRSGEIVAAASLPKADPSNPLDWTDKGPPDRLAGGTYELGSIMKIMTVAMGLELGIATPATEFDVSQPIMLGKTRISDHHGKAKLTTTEVLVRSSNVGAGTIAQLAGSEQQRAFLARLGLTGPMDTEAGPIKRPDLPANWGPAETVTISYGHGIAVAPIQFAAAAAGLVNGGREVRPTFVAGRGVPDIARKRLVAEETSRALLAMLRANVTSPHGSGRAADVPGYEVGGKTGTAERPAETGGYHYDSVISSFLAVFPVSDPRYLTLVSLHDPQPTPESGSRRTAADNAAPTTGRLIARVAPLLGVYPRAQAVSQANQRENAR